MGLSVEVGVLAKLVDTDQEGAQSLREVFLKTNDVLLEQGIPVHTEPERLPDFASRAIDTGFVYSDLHYLRRAYAHWCEAPGTAATQCPIGVDPASDPTIEEEMCNMESHLLCHSDCEGFYFPIDFDDLVFDDEDRGRIQGGTLGSSFRLHEELIAMAPCLGIDDASDLSDATVETLRAVIESETELWKEKKVWLTLYEACRLSKLHRTAICFC